ncbi:bifunctional phosphoribosylaminoimidazolecarboxamide formyltransferase/IMP cyclohydrolase, partial [Vibrio parahaemolyticus]
MKSKKNRILLQSLQSPINNSMKKSVLNGWLEQDTDTINYEKWEETGGRIATDKEKEDLIFANIVCKHLKSNAIALVKDLQLVGKGCGQ